MTIEGKAKQVDFDSAIPRFESWHPSQPVRSLRCDFQVWENRRHFRGLAGNGPVFGEENRALPTTARAYVPGKGRYNGVGVGRMRSNEVSNVAQTQLNRRGYARYQSLSALFGARRSH